MAEKMVGVAESSSGHFYLTGCESADDNVCDPSNG